MDHSELKAIFKQHGFPCGTGREYFFESHKQQEGKHYLSASWGDRIHGMHVYANTEPLDGQIRLTGIHVPVTLRRRGIGTRLMQAVEDWAQKHGINEIIADASGESHLFYSAIGFEHIRTLEGTNLKEMVKKLTK